MGWKPKNELKSEPTTELSEAVSEAITADEILNCLVNADRLERDTKSVGLFERTVNSLTDRQVSNFTWEYEIHPRTREGIIAWNDERLF